MHAGGDASWLREAHLRVIMNTVRSLRSLQSQQVDACLEDTMKRSLSRSGASLAADDGTIELRPEDREQLYRRFPLAFLSDDAQGLSLDLETVWRRQLLQLVHQRGADAAYITVNRSSGALSVLGSLAAAHGTTTAEANVSSTVGSSCDAFAVKQEPANDSGIAASSADASHIMKKRHREEDNDSAAAAAATPSSPYSWLSTLPNAACVAFAKSCFEHSKRRQCADRKVSSWIEADIEKNIAMSESRLAAAAPPETYSAVSRSTAQEGRGVLSQIKKPLEGTDCSSALSRDLFSWVVIDLPSSPQDAVADLYVCPQSQIDSIAASATLVGQVLKTGQTCEWESIHLPAAITGGLLNVDGRGEVAVRRVTFV